MYSDFFGFRDRPFRLVPDPVYLFLSKSHEEAMAHLIYAVSQGEGFVEIIGEAGTGKTTLCRAFLEKLDKGTEAAYIFNSKLDSLQLLKSIIDEFGIDSDAANIKELIDILNAFLMEKRMEGKKAILLIDEAQNLTKEVLEQLRLLSNLETTTTKLLQIILVGQPELGEMLDSYELRQLGQRITLSCRLNPLSRIETRAYIQHRIDIASQQPGVKFSRSAICTIYRYSRGIPRLINIACDRSLLLAFGLNRNEIRGREARAAIRELAGMGKLRHNGRRREHGSVFLVSLLLAAVFLFVLYHFGLFDLTALSKRGRVEKLKTFEKAKPEKETAPASSLQSGKGEALFTQNNKSNGFAIKPPEGLGGFLRRLGARSSRQGAFKTVLKLWGTAAVIRQHLENIEDDENYFRKVAIQNGFSVFSGQIDLKLVKNLGLPAILTCYLLESSDPIYVVISKLNGNNVTLKVGADDASIDAPISELKSLWPNSGHILWKNFLGLVAAPPLRFSEDSVITLKRVLQDVGFSNIQINPLYDRQTREAIKQIQARHGLEADGIVGPRTKIVLNSEIQPTGIPHISKR